MSECRCKIYDDVQDHILRGQYIKYCPLHKAAPIQHEAHEQIYDWAHKALNGGLKRAGRKVTIADYKSVLRLIRAEAQAAIAKAKKE